MKRKRLHLFLFCSYFLFATSITAQTAQEYYLPKDALNQRAFETENWVYHTGDNPDWADPEFNDTSWEPVDTRLTRDQLSKIGWQGIGWFRLHLVIDPDLLDKLLGLALNHAGVLQIYLDGKLIYRSAQSGEQQPEDIGWRGGPRPISFHDKLEHVIAVRYSNPAPEEGPPMAGFILYLGNLDYMVGQYTDNVARSRSVQGVFSALPFAFGLLHLLLFLFFRRAVGNLYFAVSMFLIALLTFLDYQSSLAADMEQSLVYLRLHRCVMPFLIIAILRFMYSLFYKRSPLQFWVLCTAAIITGVFAIYDPVRNLFYVNIVFIIAIIEMLRVNILAVYRKKDGAWIILTGFAIQIIFSFYDVFLDFRILAPVYNIQNAYFVGTFGLIICMSVYLARDFARTRKNLEESNVRLEEYSRTLEEKVAERTRSLAERNEELQTTLRKLTETQAQLVQSGKMAALGNLVAGIAHEMNNPIGVIHSMADISNRGIRKMKGLLKNIRDPGTSAQDEEQLKQSLDLLETNHQVIATASGRVANIVGSLRSFARLDEALFQRVDIHKNIDTTLTLIYHELRDKATVIKEYGEIPLIQCYPNELNQAFMNLLRNAIQAIEQQGTITIATYSDQTQVYVRISDTGKGIRQDDLPRIYDPGFTTQSGGVGKGLGLSIVYNIIQKHHGDIKVDSEVGKGTEVTISLPIEQAGSI